MPLQPSPIPFALATDRTHIARFGLANVREWAGAQRVTLLSFEADGGSGKTRAVVDLCKEFDGILVWVSVGDETNPTALALARQTLRGLASSHLSPATQVLLQRFEVLTEEAPAEWETALDRVLSKWSQNINVPVCVVFDDLHVLTRTDATTNAQATALIRSLCRHLPVASLILLTSRDTNDWLDAQIKPIPGLGLARVGRSQLAFSSKHTRSLFMRQGLNLSEAQLMAHVTWAHGQPLQLSLVARNAQQATEQTSEASGQASLGEMAIQQLIAEHLQKEPAFVREFLCQTSLFREFTLDHMNALRTAGNAEAATDAALCMASLRHPDYWFSQDATRSRFRHNHDVIRETLLLLLAQRLPANQLDALHESAATICESNGRVLDAVHHCVAAQNMQAAANYIDRHLMDWLNDNELSLLEAALKSVPAAWLTQSPKLLLAQAALRDGQGVPFEEPLRLLEQCIQMAIELNDDLSVFRANIEMARTLHNAEFYELAYQYLGELDESHLQSLPEMQQVRCLSTAILVYRCVGRVHESLKCGNRAVGILLRLNKPQTYVSVLKDLIWTHQVMGNVKEATKCSEFIIQECRRLNINNGMMAYLHYQNAWIMLLVGRLPEANESLNAAKAWIDEHIPSQQAYRLRDYINRRRAEYFTQLLEYDQAEHYLRLFGPEYDAKDDNWLYATAWQVRIAQSSRSKEHQQKFLDLMQWTEPLVDKAKNMAQINQASCHLFLGVAELFKRNWAAARTLLERAKLTQHRINVHYELTNTYFWLAWLEQQTNNPRAAKHCLQRVLDYMSRESVLNLETAAPAVMAELWAIALTENIQRKYVCQIAQHPFLKNSLGPFKALLQHESPDVRQCAKAILEAHHDSSYLDLATLQDRMHKPCPANCQPHFAEWLASGWLLPGGLLRLVQLFTWRQMHLFLLWLSPATDGSIKQVAIIANGMKSIEEVKGREAVSTQIMHAKARLRDECAAPAIGHFADFHRWAREADIIFEGQ